MIDGLKRFLEAITTFFEEIVVVLDQTTSLLNGIHFENSIIAHYLGYVRTVFGAPLWMLFTTVLLVPIGVSIWIYSLKGIDLVKRMFTP